VIQENPGRGMVCELETVTVPLSSEQCASME
jgi:hypothetical protein